MWSERYRPRRLSELASNRQAGEALAKWLKGWKKGSKAALLCGPPGTGKTSTAHALAEENGMEIVELNASDARTKARLEEKLENALTSTDLFGKRLLLFLDEVDGLSGRSDYGGLEFIKEAIKRSSNPMVLAANDTSSEIVKKLLQSCVVMRFESAKPDEVASLLKKIAERERLELSESSLISIAERCMGDIRNAINLLQSGSLSEADRKDRELGEAESINSFFSSSTAEERLKALRLYSNSEEEKLKHVFFSIVADETDPKRRAKILEVISRADLMMRRVKATQEWRLVKYIDPFLAYGLSARAKYKEYDKLPWPLQLRLWNDSKKITEISEAVAPLVHESSSSFRAGSLSLLLVLARSQKQRKSISSLTSDPKKTEEFLAKESGKAAVAVKPGKKP